MIKVLHILPMDKMSGAERVALIIGQHLSDSYQAVYAVGGEELEKIFSKEGLDVYNLNFKDKNKMNLIKRLNYIIRLHDIEIIHAHDNTASIIAYIIKILFRKNFLIISHIHNCYPWLEGKNKFKVIDQLVRNKYDYNIACGSLVYNYYLNNAEYINKDKLITLSNTIDVNVFKKYSNKEQIQLKNNYNIPLDKFVIGYIGRFCEQKGIKKFIQEFIPYSYEFKDCIFLLVGNGEDENEIKKLIIENNLTSQFILIDFQKEVYPIYSIIDIFFLPSLYEGLPMVLLEAMASKKPIVSMNVGSINEIIKDNFTGRLIKSGEYDLFIKALIEVKNNTYKQKYLGEQAYIYLNNNFSIEKYMSDLQSLYSTLLKRCVTK